MTNRKKRTIAVASAKATIAALEGKTPPNLYVPAALAKLGPDIRRALKEDWTDEDLIAEFSGQDPTAFKKLLKLLRAQERDARRSREQKQAQKRGSSRGPAPPAPPAPPGPPPPGGPPPQAAQREHPASNPMLPVSAVGRTHQVTRNRGIRRPDPKGPSHG